jgi:hypothetical protein
MRDRDSTVKNERDDSSGEKRKRDGDDRRKDRKRWYNPTMWV